MKYFFLLVLLSMGNLNTFQAEAVDQKAVTYTFSGGRFGDNLLAYLHAKWISYHYKIPLLYKPFEYSDQLILHRSEKHYSEDSYRLNKTKIISLGKGKKIKKRPFSNTLYIVPYFPESSWEREHSLDSKGNPEWGYIPIDWNDPGFREEIKRVVAPIFKLEKFNLPSDKVTVAVHIRRGGGVDTEHTFRNAALKFPQDNFYISEIRWLSNFFNKQPLYIYLFTDDPNPLQIKHKYEAALNDCPLQFECRTEKNAHNINVLEDFFALTQFDCAIHGESNFAVCAGKIHEYMVEIQPETFHWEGPQLIIDNVQRKIKKDQPQKSM